MANDLIEIGINVRSNAETASRGLNRLEGSVVKNLRAAERLEKEYKRLDRAFNANKISAQTYARGVQEVDRSIENLWKETDRATQATQRLNAATNKSRVAQNQFGVLADDNTRRFKRFGAVGLQQVGYQVGDFAVQIQGGTNALVALGQQGSQLLGILGPMGAVAGSALAIYTSIARVRQETSGLTFDFKAFSTDVLSSLEPIMPVLTAIGDAVKAVMRTIIQFADLAIQNLDTIAVAAGGFAAVMLTRMVPSIVAATKAMTAFTVASMRNPIILGATAIASAIALIYELSKSFGSVTEAIDLVGQVVKEVFTFDSIVNGLLALSAKVYEVFSGITVDLGTIAKDILAVLLEPFNKLGAVVMGVYEGIKATWDQLPGLFKSAGAAAANFFINGMEALARGATKSLNKIIEGLNSILDFVGAKKAAELFGFSGQINTLDLPDLSEFRVSAGEEGQTAGQAFSEGFSRGYDESLVETPVLDSIDRIIAGAKSAEDASRAIAKAYGSSFMESNPALEELIKRVKEGSSEVSDLADYFKEVGDTADKAGKAGSKAGKDIEKAMKTTQDVFDDAFVTAQEFEVQLAEGLVKGIDSVSNAWSDFVMRGFKDFKSFADAVFSQFKNLIAQMIATAAKNRIMISLGLGGGGGGGGGLLSSVLGGGGSGGGGFMSSTIGSMGTGQGLSGLAGGTGFMGGVGNSLAAFSGGIGSGFGASFSAAGSVLSGGASVAAGGAGLATTIGAAVPAIGAVIAGASILSSIFGGGGREPILTKEQYEKIAEYADLTGQSIDDLARELNGGAGKIDRDTQRIIKSIADIAGGIEEFGEKAEFYAQNFLTQGEQDQIAQRRAMQDLNEEFDDLNVAIPKTHAEYRKLVEAQDLATEAGREMYAGLLDAAEAFVAVKGTAEQAAAARGAEIKAESLRQEKEDALQQEIIDAYDKRVKEFAEIRNSLILSGDAPEAAAEQFRLLRGDPKDGDSVGFSSFLRVQRSVRQDTSSLALEVENVEESLSGVMASFSNLPGRLNSATKLGEATVGEFFTNVTERAQEASMGLRKLIPLIGQRQLEVRAGDALTGGTGILGVRAAATELALLRKEFRQYPRAVDALREANKEGIISSEEFATVMRTLNHELEEAHAVSLQVADAEDKRAERLRLQQEALDRQQKRIIDAGIDSIRGYFGQLGKAASSLEENFSEVEQANNAVDIATSAIGRFNSASTVFTESVDAITGALSGAEGRLTIRDDEERLMERSEAIASAAERLSEIVTTQDASRAQEELEDSAAFAGETNSFVRKVALMLQGVSEFDIPALENSFLKLSGSFSKGNISQDQYNEAIDFAVSQFEGLSSETEKLDQQIQEVQSTFESLADAARSLIDGLLVSEQTTGLSPEQRLLEARRQQREVFDLASAGDEAAISRLSGVTDTFLNTAKSLAGSAEEYNRTFFSTIGQLESLEERGLAGAETDNLSFADGGIASGPTSGFQATLHGTEAVIPMNGQRIPLEVNNKEMIQELRDLRKEVSQLRTEQGQSQYQIARNTKRTRDTLEQFDIEGLPPERSAT
jgi:hypothetical protein